MGCGPTPAEGGRAAEWHSHRRRAHLHRRADHMIGLLGLQPAPPPVSLTAAVGTRHRGCGCRLTQLTSSQATDAPTRLQICGGRGTQRGRWLLYATRSPCGKRRLSAMHDGPNIVHAANTDYPRARQPESPGRARPGSAPGPAAPALPSRPSAVEGSPPQHLEPSARGLSYPAAPPSPCSRRLNSNGEGVPARRRLAAPAAKDGGRPNSCSGAFEF